MGNNQEMNFDTSFENEYQVQLENDLNSSFEKAFNNQFGKFEKGEDSITSYENLNQKCNKEAKLDIKDNKEKESEQKNERKDFVESKGKSFIVINKDKKHKILEKYNKEKTENNSSSTQKTESSTQLNKDEEIENKKDSNENKSLKYNNKEKIDLIILDKQIEDINIEESEEIESKVNNNNDTININTPNIPEENSEDTNLNKKRNRDKNINNKKINFNKIIRRIKISILDAIIRFINHKIEIDYNYDIGKGICEKKILQIDKKELTHTKVEENKKFLFKNLKDILATNISKRYTNYKKTHNIELIQDLIINKGEDYKKIFELTFSQCVEYIRGTKNISILDGLDKIDDIIKNEEQKMYKDEIENFVDFIMDYENIIDRKKGRNSKNQKNG